MVDREADGREVVGSGRVALSQHRHCQPARQHNHLGIARQARREARADLISLLTVDVAAGRDHDSVTRLQRQSCDLQLNIPRHAALLRARFCDRGKVRKEFLYYCRHRCLQPIRA